MQSPGSFDSLGAESDIYNLDTAKLIVCTFRTGCKMALTFKTALEDLFRSDACTIDGCRASRPPRRNEKSGCHRQWSTSLRHRVHDGFFSSPARACQRRSLLFLARLSHIFSSGSCNSSTQFALGLRLHWRIRLAEGKTSHDTRSKRNGCRRVTVVVWAGFIKISSGKFWSGEGRRSPPSN